MASWLEQSITLPGNLNVAGLFFAVILLSYLLEDLAIITAALLAADNSLPPSLALLAIFIGIASGDVALYGLGLLASRWRALRYRLLSHKGMRTVRTKLKHRTFINIALIRFVPGLRTLGFTLSGLFRVHFIQYIFAVLLATAAWTGIVFFSIYQLGSIPWLQETPWKWLIVPFALAGLWTLNRSATRKSPKKKRHINKSKIEEHQFERAK